MNRLKWISIGLAMVLVALIVTLFPVQVKIDSNGFLSVGIAKTNYQTLAADITEIKAYAQMETSGCCIYKGKVQLRFDLFLEPDAPGYEIHHVQVVDTNSEGFLEGYQGEVDRETGEPLDWYDFNRWWDSLPLVWQNNPFHSVFIFVDATTTDGYIKDKEAEILEQAYKYWILNLYDMAGAYKVLPLDGLIDEESLSPEPAQLAKLNNLLANKAIFDTTSSAQFVLNVGGVGVASANPDPIDVGASAIDRNYVGAIHSYTRVSESNPANDSGTITSVESWYAVGTETDDVWIGTFSASGNVLTCRDSESIGDVVPGSKQTASGLDITIETGDYIGVHAKSGYALSIELDASGDGWWYVSGEYIDPSDSTTFSYKSSRTISLYGEGETAGCSEDITNSPSSWSVNGGTPVDVNSNYFTGLTYFTVTNNSGGAVDIAISGTDMTGGGYTWTLSDTATPGDMIYGLKAGLSGGDYTIVVKKNSPYNNLVTGLADSGTQDWGLKIYTPTSYDDGNAKSGTVTITATCA